LVQLGIGLGRGDGFVPQGYLDEPDVAGGIVKPRGKCVSQSVGRNGFVDSGLDYSLANDPLDLPCGEAMTAGISEQWLSQVCPTVERSKYSHDRLTHRDNFRISALGLMKRDSPSVPVDVPDIQRNCLTKSAASSQHERQQRAITFGPLPFEIEGQQQLNFITSKDDWWETFVSFASQDCRGISLHQPPRFTPSEHGLQADPIAVDGRLSSRGATRANLHAVVGHEAGQQGRGDSVNGDASRELCKRIKVSSIRSNGVRRAVIIRQVYQKLGDCFCGRHGALLSSNKRFCGMNHSRSIGELYQVISDMVAMVYVGEQQAIGGTG
jgi:hypothetical protein